jgi:YhcH/YjgK/YiaL family protein
MKKFNAIAQKLLVFIMSGFFGLSSVAQTAIDIGNKKQVTKWYKTSEWLHEGHIKPHKSTNQQAFAREYFSNKALWDKTFEWMKSTDINSLAPGRYIIEEGNSIATISEAPAPELNNIKWEIHKKFNDIQYIINGKTKMGVIPVSKAIVTEPYDVRRDIGFFEAKGKFHVAESGTFFIFTPDDVHKPGVKIDGFDTVKKLVIKVKATN